MKLYETDVDVSGEKFLQDGASELSLSIAKIKKTLELGQGNPKIGKFEISARGPLCEGFIITWWIDPEQAEKKDAYMSFTLK